MESKPKEKGFMDLRNENEILLNNEEKKILEQLNSFANKSKKEAIKQSAFYNLSLKDLIEKFMSTWNNIIIEFISVYKKKNIEKNPNYWWNNIKYLVSSIIDIITKGDRLIYVGIMLIIISFFLYFILISS